MMSRIFFIRGQRSSKAAGGWSEAGKLLRLAADLDAGAMRVAVVETDGTSAGGENSKSSLYPPPIAHIPLVADWQTIYSSGLQPSAAVGAALFPAIRGYDGARLRCNFGLDQRRPLRFPPSKPEGAQHEQVLLSWTCI
jgi:hypothetical protein